MAFRLFKHEWVGTDYPNHDENDVKDCVKKLIDPLVTGGCGWSWDETHCPNSEPINLIPSNRVFAAFIKHSSGAKAMIGYSLYGIRYGDDNQTDGTNYDVGFIPTWKHISTGSTTNKMVSLFFSFITADSVNNNHSDFHPEYSTFDENFYDSQMSKIFTLGSSVYTSSSYLSQCTPMIKNVTDNNVCKHYIMADTNLPILYLGSQYNNTGLKQAMFGEIADGQKRYDYDIRDTSKFRCLLGCGAESAGSSAYGEKTITLSYSTSDSTKTSLYTLELVKFTTSGYITTGDYPKYFCGSWASITPRTALYVFDNYRVWNPVIRCIHQEGLTQGQVYDRGQWCCLGDVTLTKNSYARSFKVSEDGGYFYYTIIVAWDSEFNQGNRLV